MQTSPTKKCITLQVRGEAVGRLKARREGNESKGKRGRGRKVRARGRDEVEWECNEEGQTCRYGGRGDIRELLSYVSQNYKTLILKLPSARVPLRTGEKKEGDRRLRVIVTLFTRSASNCLSLLARAAGSACLWIRGSVEETAGCGGGRGGATQRETLDESTVAHPRLPARGAERGERGR